MRLSRFHRFNKEIKSINDSPQYSERYYFQGDRLIPSDRKITRYSFTLSFQPYIVHEKNRYIIRNFGKDEYIRTKF